MQIFMVSVISNITIMIKKKLTNTLHAFVQALYLHSSHENGFGSENMQCILTEL